MTVHDNSTASRFEFSVGDAVAVAEYARRAQTITFTHTEVPDALQGRGIGTRLVRGALEQARADGLRVIPRCPFVLAVLRRFPDLAT